jgi:hypothetical protein
VRNANRRSHYGGGEDSALLLTAIKTSQADCASDSRLGQRSVKVAR